ncbi:helix-turn-helix domain-containing protein [Shewanella intestini]|uniref:AraC family transcriptional regulator n=1 Tax=Shewanella intestini TaxID=2017544 RepID=A0ABS5I5Z0_9GAMM|nr:MULTISPECIES: AraC family transcriptional regulator [Shewanella]MBR9728800.1 AraC family transcriptional regulator [Shewanella intestini]MRG36875.1 helix-turn-helix domain-containing protein [Shewanella sp. XMDDZSB0408]
MVTKAHKRVCFIIKHFINDQINIGLLDAFYMKNLSPYGRTEHLLDYIHRHITQPLSLDDLAQKSHLSRWQLQRIFQQQTGLNLAQYVRELKLSMAAERVVTTTDRMLDIAYQLGFASEVSFSRAFKQFFGLTPSQYRQRGTKVGLRNTITQRAEHFIDSTSLQTRIEHKPAFTVYGISTPLNGVLADTPDFDTVVPALWQQLFSMVTCKPILDTQLVGIIDTQQQTPQQPQLHYWATLDFGDTDVTTPNIVTNAQLKTLIIPSQEYAVVAYHGLLSGFSQLIEWLICDWLPQSGFESVPGFELERYGVLTPNMDDPKQMEYWLPIRSISPR